MSDVVNLSGSPVDLSSELGRELTVDFVRYAEGLMDESAIRKKYRFTNDVWETLGNDDAFVGVIEKEKVRRIRNGDSAREKAQQLFVSAPGVLGDILHSADASPRHRIESAKELRVIAANGPEAAAPPDRFIIRIDLSAGGGEVLTYNKSIIECDAHDVTPDNPDTNSDTDDDPQGWLLAAAAKNKSGDGGSGEPI